MATLSKGHIEAAKRVLRYLKGTQHHGIAFHSDTNNTLEAFIKFPINKIVGFTDANWGPQDQSVPKPTVSPVTLELFKSRSLSGFIIYDHGPIHWMSKRQSITARSSAEAEIYATDECVKSLLHMSHIITELGLSAQFLSVPVSIFNDNNACVCWSHNLTTKGLRHLQMRENAVRESVDSGFIEVKHIAGVNNPSDLFTKEDKNATHYISIRDQLVCIPPNQNLDTSKKVPSPRGVLSTTSVHA